MIVLLLHSVIPLFFIHIFYGSIILLSNTNITYDCTFVTFGDSLIFYGFNLIWGSTNITYNHIFITFGSSVIF